MYVRMCVYSRKFRMVILFILYYGVCYKTAPNVKTNFKDVKRIPYKSETNVNGR